jgi:LexA DNA binding domain-containing protein
MQSLWFKACRQLLRLGAVPPLLSPILQNPLFRVSKVDCGGILAAVEATALPREVTGHRLGIGVNMERKRLAPDDHAALLVYIRNYRAENGVPPSQRDIAAYLGITLSGAHDRLIDLERKGYLSRSTGRRARALRLTVKGAVMAAKYRLQDGEAL